ncbi:dCTP deaminase [Candidatus Peregrinibacteria bacterium HGW-Peregrinibacteria-1]|jgi:dCTP deaminase|nr:MAG: dCTP deaminase [Candidatus Peregrinibacteria bacterium HGW-Peregrinibacteria-1]
MAISDSTLREMLRTGELVVDPIDEQSIQPASIDCRLADHFLILEENQMEVLTLDSEVHYREVIGDSIIIPPHSFLLGTTQEYLEIPNDITAFVEGRSSIGRMGLFIQNAGLIDAGFKGRITLELFNASSIPIKLEAGKRICQLVFTRMDKCAENPYQGKYQGQGKTVGSRIHKDVDKVKVNL